MDNAVVEVKNIWKSYEIKRWGLKKQSFYALMDVSLGVFKGETVGVLGESGCGKTTLGKIILDLEKPDKGDVLWFGKDVKRLSKKEYRGFRAKIQTVFQDPYSSLNPRYKVADILLEPYFINVEKNKRRGLEKAEEVLSLVGLRKEVLNKYPHALSGGERQRVALARALMVSPSLIVLDEPTSALDTTLAGQILELLKDLKLKFHLSYLLISHSLPVIIYLSDWIVVMYLGRIVEVCKKDIFFKSVHHPYTLMLLNASPDPFSPKNLFSKKVRGEVASAFFRPSGCEFHPRCEEREKFCSKKVPQLRKINDFHYISCFKR
ncbi:MAG: ABC-type dipeptide/oligopeptide/nickel transport system [Thermodesulfobacterium sp.]|uniref:ABC-type dipeptide/oligopeptide/nickel transport system n=1 Tax=Candidatus Thermodesulfobacterium syntrophicum TaxID=3060442 RepID=A0AAE3P1S9_9BACT|nr:ABC-type dipeptide/oligopeptide/nickel transport system [Candidatus Thermodesulfobacterium syntrophicum]